MQNGFVESFNGRMRDELLNEMLVESAARGPTTTRKDRTHPLGTRPRRHSPPAMQQQWPAPPRRPLLQPRSCATTPPDPNPSPAKAGGHVTADKLRAVIDPDGFRNALAAFYLLQHVAHIPAAIGCAHIHCRAYFTAGSLSQYFFAPPSTARPALRKLCFNRQDVQRLFPYTHRRRTDRPILTSMNAVIGIPISA